MNTPFYKSAASAMGHMARKEASLPRMLADIAKNPTHRSDIFRAFPGGESYQYPMAAIDAYREGRGAARSIAQSGAQTGALRGLGSLIPSMSTFPEQSTMDRLREVLGPRSGEMSQMLSGAASKKEIPFILANHRPTGGLP